MDLSKVSSLVMAELAGLKVSIIFDAKILQV